MIICLDPGHGMANRKAGAYDPGACFDRYSEAAIVMEWANELREVLIDLGHTVVRTRIDAKDPAPIVKRPEIARQYGCDVMLSLHCNAANGQANGTETFYRGDGNAELAARVNLAVIGALGTRNRGIKTESASQHSRLAVLGFPRCVLLEIGFIDHPGDRAVMLDPIKRLKACEALAQALTA
jgi:N-acetylmuramoyl-L-alanine amidase